MVHGIISERKLLAIWYDTRKGVYKTNVRICIVEIVEAYKGIKVDKPYNVKKLEKLENEYELSN